MKIGVAGCAGRMGTMIVRQLATTAGVSVAGGFERPESPALGRDVAALAGLDAVGLEITEDAEGVFQASDAVIDFTMPAATVRNAALAAAHGTALIVGTTGLDTGDQRHLETAAEKIALVQSANMSLGVNLLLGLVEQAGRILDPAFDIEIVEMHHRHKVDAPSGTALALGRAVAAGRAVALDDAAVRVRDGHTGQRRAGDIGFAVMRGGDVVGEHTVVFAGEGERIELGHRATGRHIFAAGAVRAALWTAGRPPGLYRMKDVLGLS